MNKFRTGFILTTAPMARVSAQSTITAPTVIPLASEMGHSRLVLTSTSATP